MKSNARVETKSRDILSLLAKEAQGNVEIH